MKTSTVTNCISIALLRFVRDSGPTEAELLAWLGAERQGRYHTLRKAGVLLLQDGVVVASPRHLSTDGKHLRFEHMRYNIDEDTIDTFRVEVPSRE